MKDKTKNIILYIILGLFSLALILGGFYLLAVIKNNKYIEFENEMTVIIEENNLTEYQEEKIEYKMEEYRVEKNYILDPYYVDGFNRYLKSTDYDFWYEIKDMFEE